MSKDQEVRKRRLEANDITVQAEKVFDWILDLIDEDTRKLNLVPLELYLSNYEENIKSVTIDGTEGKEYDLSGILRLFDRHEFFKTLKKVIDQKDGYKANILFPVLVGFDGKAIAFQVFIE